MADKNKRVKEAYQSKGEPKDGRKVSRPKVTKPDELSSAHDNEKFRKDFDRKSGGRA